MASAEEVTSIYWSMYCNFNETIIVLCYRTTVCEYLTFITISLTNTTGATLLKLGGYDFDLGVIKFEIHTRGGVKGVFIFRSLNFNEEININVVLSPEDIMNH